MFRRGGRISFLRWGPAPLTASGLRLGQLGGRALAAAQRLGVFSIAVSATGVVIPSGRLIARDGAVLGKDVLLANLGLHASARSTWPASLRPRSPGTTRSPTGSAG